MPVGHDRRPHPIHQTVPRRIPKTRKRSPNADHNKNEHRQHQSRSHNKPNRTENPPRHIAPFVGYAISTAYTTLPSSQSGNLTNPATGSYRVSYVATWNSGALTAITVTEVDLWICYYNATASKDLSQLKTFGFDWDAASMSDQTASFFSRLSEADGDFSSFVVNTAVPLTIEWRLTFSFA
jgi:hypothetical protein